MDGRSGNKVNQDHMGQRKNSWMKLIGAILVLILIGFAARSAYRHSHFLVTSTDPATDKVLTVSPFFKVDFNKPLSSSGLSVTTDPNIKYNNQVRVSGNTLTVYLNVPLDSAKTYRIIINRVSSTSGQHITNKQFSFKPRVGTQNQLGEDEQEALIQRNGQSAVYKDPILPHLPYRSVDFSLTSSIGSGANNQATLTLQAQLFIHTAQTGDTVSAIAQDKQEVQDYIKSLGLDPSNYTIKYTAITP
jgi:hypothetical protein